MKKIFYCLITSILVLFLLECFARLWESVYSDIQQANQEEGQQWRVYSPEIGWERKPGFKGSIYGATREFDTRGFLSVDSRQIDDLSLKHILFFGDSNTFGVGVPVDKTFVEVLDKKLPECNMINLSVPVYSSFQGRIALEKNLPMFTPAAVVVSFNWNDRVHVHEAERVDSEAWFEKAYHRLKKQNSRSSMETFLERIALFRTIERIMISSGLIREDHTFQQLDNLTLADIFPRVNEEKYRNNLNDMIEICTKASVPIIFLSLHDNPVQSAYLRSGIEAIDRMNFEEALLDLRSALIKDNEFSLLARVYLNKTYRHAGLFVEAESISHLPHAIPSLFGGGALPVRLDREYNQIMYDLALESGIKFVDGGSALDQHPSDYLDFCHPDVQGHQRLADLLLPILQTF